MKKIYVLSAAAAALAIITFSACNGLLCKKGSGKQITETRKVDAFSKLDISGGYDVVIKQDSVQSLTISADDNLMKYIKTEASGDKLRVHTSASLCSAGKFVLNISLRDISSIKTSGTVNISSTGKINTKDFSLDLSGASKVTLDLNANIVSTKGSGLTELNLTGQASTHNIELSGSGRVNALDFVVAKYHIETSGSSHCQINVLNELDINSSGLSDIAYRGNPVNINNNKSGASTLKKIE